MMQNGYDYDSVSDGQKEKAMFASPYLFCEQLAIASECPETPLDTMFRSTCVFSSPAAFPIKFLEPALNVQARLNKSGLVDRLHA